VSADIARCRRAVVITRCDRAGLGALVALNVAWESFLIRLPAWRRAVSQLPDWSPFIAPHRPAIVRVPPSVVAALHWRAEEIASGTSRAV
jgi:hypothetical protein